MGAKLKVNHSESFINIALKLNPKEMSKGGVTLNEHHNVTLPYRNNAIRHGNLVLREEHRLK